MRKSTLIGAGAALMLLAGAAIAATAPSSSEALTAALGKRLPNTKLTKVDCDKIDGFCEIQAGKSLFYTDRRGRYLVVGRVYDMETRQDITAAALLAINPDMLLGGAAAAAAEVGGDAPSPGRGTAHSQPAATQSRVSLDKLSSAGAIEWGGSGPTVTVFSDFRCGYCKMLHGQLRQMNVRVIERPISVLGTRLLSEAVICAPDRRRAMQQAYDGAELPRARGCDTTGLDANEAFAKASGFSGTPVIVRSDGAVVEGYRPKEFLENWLRGGKS